MKYYTNFDFVEGNIMICQPEKKGDIIDIN